MEESISTFSEERSKRIALTTSSHLVFVERSEIMYCESESNYTTFFLSSGERVVVCKTLKKIAERLGDEDFFRVHASYLVNLKHVSRFTRGSSATVVLTNSQHIPVSRRNKEKFLEIFSRL